MTDSGQSGFLKDRRGNVVKSRLDDAALTKIATTTGGAYLHGSGSDLRLDTLYNDYIATMEKRELKSAMERRYEERFQFPLLLALLLLVLEPLVGARRRTTAQPAQSRPGWEKAT